MKLGSESGGIVYHLRALTLGKRLWQPHWAGVRNFLISLQLDGIDDLILVGPSGGYSLPPDWLANFKSVTVYEPDLLARLIFRARFSGLSFSLKGEFGPKELDTLANSPRARKTLVLFANVLGQVDLNLEEDPRWSGWIQKIAIASFHDSFSIEFPRKIARPGSVQTAAEFLDLINRIWDPSWGIAEINEHHVPGISHGLQLHGGWVWQITPNRIHWIEGVYTAPLIR